MPVSWKKILGVFELRLWGGCTRPSTDKEKEHRRWRCRSVSANGLLLGNSWVVLFWESKFIVKGKGSGRMLVVRCSVNVIDEWLRGLVVVGRLETWMHSYWEYWFQLLWSDKPVVGRMFVAIMSWLLVLQVVWIEWELMRDGIKGIVMRWRLQCKIWRWKRTGRG